MAIPANSTIAPLSSLIRDPLVRNAFQRAERDDGEAFTVVVIDPVLSGGDAADARVQKLCLLAELYDRADEASRARVIEAIREMGRPV